MNDFKAFKSIRLKDFSVSNSILEKIRAIYWEIEISALKTPLFDLQYYCGYNGKSKIYATVVEMPLQNVPDECSSF